MHRTVFLENVFVTNTVFRNDEKRFRVKLVQTDEKVVQGLWVELHIPIIGWHRIIAVDFEPILDNGLLAVALLAGIARLKAGLAGCIGLNKVACVCVHAKVVNRSGTEDVVVPGKRVITVAPIRYDLIHKLLGHLSQHARIIDAAIVEKLGVNSGFPVFIIVDERLDRIGIAHKTDIPLITVLREKRGPPSRYQARCDTWRTNDD